MHFKDSVDSQILSGYMYVAPPLDNRLTSYARKLDLLVSLVSVVKGYTANTSELTAE